MRRISLTGKHFLVYLSICIVTLAAVAFYSYYSAKNALLARTFEQLTSVRIEKSNSVSRYFGDRIRDVEMVTSSDVIKQYFRTSHKPITIAEGDFSDSVFSTYLNSFLRSSGCYRKIFLVKNDGPVRFAALERSVEGDNILRPCDSSILFGIKDLIHRITSTRKTCFQDYTYNPGHSATMFVGSPVSDKERPDENGVVILEIDVTSLNDLMFENDPQYGIGNTGEAYIVGNDYMIRTASRFQDNSIFTTRVETEGVIRALAGETSSAIISDYREVPVLSSFGRIQIPELNWVMVAEIDKEEAMLPVISLRYDILWLACIITFLMSGVVYIISRRMASRSCRT